MEPLSLPFSVSRSKGAYALLLGSGVSRSAEILTGWDITCDLICQVARLRGESLTLDEAPDWYRNEFGMEPDYSDLLKKLAPKPADRNSILRSYFVPTQEEREQGVKVPQDGHHAIAELVAGGYVRVIITTNFDMLIEDALTQAGIDAQVVSTVDAINGATPLAHAVCTVFKVHGDYRDARILNTEAELSKYRPALNRLLDRIFDEYGLIVCGWSCEWDPALRAALERRPNRRYATYWTHLSPLKEEAQRLTAHLSAEPIQITGADQFFRDLTESVKAIEDTAQPHPLSARVAEATVKRYVAEDRYRIRLSELVLREARRVHDATAWPALSSAPMRMTTKELEQRLRLYQTQSRSLMAMMVAGCYWGGEQQHPLWGRAMRRLSHFQMQPGGRWIDTHYLQLYPTLLAIYSGGIAALGADRYDTLAALLLPLSWPDPQDKVSLPMALHAVPGRSLPPDLAKLIPAHSNSITPVSDYLRNQSGIQQATHEVWMDADNFDDLFDWFELFLGMVVWHLTEKYWQSPWAYRGGFAWRNNPSRESASMPAARRIWTELDSVGANWPPLRAGFFEGAPGKAFQVFNAYTAKLDQQRF